FTARSKQSQTDLRAKAWERFGRLGLPTYRYARLQDLYTMPFRAGRGRYAMAQRSGVDILPLDEAMRTYRGFLQGRVDQYLKAETDPFSALNVALHDCGLFIYVPPHTDVKEPLFLHHLIEEMGQGDVLMPRLHLFVGRGARLHLIMQGTYQG